MMKSYLLSGFASAVLLLTGAAFAADVPEACSSYKPAVTGGPMPPPESDVVVLRWLGNANNPMAAKYKLLKSGTDEQKKEVSDYARNRNLEPSIENQRVYRNVHPGDGKEIFVDILAGKDNRFDIGVFSK